MYPLPYGGTTVPLSIPPTHPFDLVTYRILEGDARPGAAEERIREALQRPTGSPRLAQLAAGRSSAVILISDGTRLCPSHLLLPPLLQELNEAGLPDEAIDIVIALGLHRRHTKDEMEQLVGKPIYQRIRVHNHSTEPEDCVRLGLTTSGTPVEINRLVAHADLRIVTGNIEPHALAGVSGGVKALLPGVASKRCIEHNHGLSQGQSIQVGDPDNPVHRDMEEALKYVAVDFMLNVVVNHRREVLEAVAGHVQEAHRCGVQKAIERFIIPVDKSYDLTIVSPGGRPKDLQLYQSIKSLRNAAALTKPGGTILMAAECPEQLGNGIFQYWVDTMKDRQYMVSKLNRQFVLGAHKILHLDEVLSKHRVHLLSAMPTAVVQLLGFEPTADLQASLEQVLAESHGQQSIACMPFGAITFPVSDLEARTD